MFYFIDKSIFSNLLRWVKLHWHPLENVHLIQELKHGDGKVGRGDGKVGGGDGKVGGGDGKVGGGGGKVGGGDGKVG